jgi:hypothetical protein
MKMSLPRATSPHSTRVPRGFDVALGKEAFAGLAMSSALCREPLGKGTPKGKVAFAKSMA